MASLEQTSQEPRTHEFVPPSTTATSQAGESSVPGSPTTPATQATAAPQPTLLAALSLPRFFGAYELLERLGKGGMGVVYRARDLTLGREVALKMLRGGPFEDEHGVARFFLEARAAARLDHPHIVPVYEVAEQQGQHYYTMRLLAGSVAKQVSEERQRFVNDPRAAVELMEKVARAVHFAHEHGVLHRDLKPGNILLDDAGEPLVGDFGLAKLLDDNLELTQSGMPVGTIPYMPPEQAAGRKDLISAASDVWSLGVTLYELLTGVRPFAGDSQEEILSQIKSSEPTPPRKLQPKLDRDLETICLKCLEKEPRRRYASAREVAEDLRRWQVGEPIAARASGPLRRVANWARRRRSKLAWTSFAVIIALGLGVIPFANGPQTGPARTRRTVQIMVHPRCAAVIFVPLSAEDGNPLPAEAIRLESEGEGPWRARLPPGNYLVEAVQNDQTFHQVYRTVPEDDRAMAGMFAHDSWIIQEDGTVELQPIKFPAAAVLEGMAFFAGKRDFEMGSRDFPMLAAPHKREVQPFYLDTTEVTIGQYRKVTGGLPSQLAKNAPPDSHAVSFVTFDQAVRYAELVGKRLPSEAEMEYAATLGGKVAYPWGGKAESIKSWPFGPVGEPDYDKTDTQPPVHGLYSNVAEWTSSWPVLYPNSPPGWLPSDYRNGRIVRGGGYSVVTGKPEPADWKRGPRWRHGLGRHHAPLPGLGFRCAKSERPQYVQLSK